ncbi:NAD(P)/FAD-dependent oxidoreductase [Rhabdothermincola salaria]|uniref:NAD(P)/FAD-dependent oxidoreductase n=1 Tax=Rhabdothermincola salaria TaxID=2903142 RepID=UPI001E295006|nr:FAD-dependent oxidoreductase [Rhabdothermincola salaria]MCD9625207.1 FAD-binding oxidoreductase [Rhabdothermincola salaria]
MFSPSRRAVVLGGGIQGTCVSLALARRGWQVAILDRTWAPWSATSLRGEGKIHLGHVYANDAGRATADLMATAAVRFSSLIDSWSASPVEWAAVRSEPFVYGVLEDTMVAPDRLAEHYAWVDDRVADLLAGGDGTPTYLGSTALAPTLAVTDLEARGFGNRVVAAFATEERAVDPHVLRGHLVGALAPAGVEVCGGVEVREVTSGPAGFAVRGTTTDGGSRRWEADAVVNCLWGGRLAIDASMGIAADRPCSYRLKYAVQGVLPPSVPALPSATLVLGPFGDVVRRQDGRVYASWYPECLAGWSDDLEPPSSWLPAIHGEDPAGSQVDLARRTVAGLARHVPALAALRVDAVAAGVIVAWGERDIDQPSSELHRRDAIGVHDHDGYVSVDTGKFTTAPLFAHQVASLLGPGSPQVRS